MVCRRVDMSHNLLMEPDNRRPADATLEAALSRHISLCSMYPVIG